MSARPLRAAVIGAGAIAHQHLQFLSTSTSAELVGVCDRSPALSTWAADTFGGVAFQDSDVMLRECGAEVVHILTPPASHLALATAALEAGAHVLVEKPLAATLAEFETLYDAAEARGLTVMENQNYRFNDQILELSSRIRSGELGALVDAEVRLSLDFASDDRFSSPLLNSPVGHLRGGAIRDFLPHAVGLIFELCGEADPTDLHASWWSLKKIERLGPDELDVVYDVKGVRCRIRVSASTKPEGFRVVARGTGGATEVDLFQPVDLRESARDGGALSPLIDQIKAGTRLVTGSGTGLAKKVLQHTPYHGLNRLLGHYYHALQTGTALPLEREQILRCAGCIDQIAETAP